MILGRLRTMESSLMLSVCAFTPLKVLFYHFAVSAAGT